MYKDKTKSGGRKRVYRNSSERVKAWRAKKKSETIDKSNVTLDVMSETLDLDDGANDDGQPPLPTFKTVTIDHETVGQAEPNVNKLKLNQTGTVKSSNPFVT